MIMLEFVGGGLPRNVFQIIYFPMKLRNANLLGHQGQVIKGHPLYGLQGPAGFI